MGIIISLFISFSLISCTDDALSPEKGNDNSDGSTSDYYFSFKVGIPSLGNSTRAGSSSVEEYEDYVDIKKTYIMFFLSEEKSQETGSTDDNATTDKLLKIFKPNDPAISMIPVGFSTTDDYEKSWFVRISIPDIKDAEGREIGNYFARILRENDFRIAVLANADPAKELKLSEGKIMPAGEYDLKEASDIQELHRQSDNTDIYIGGSDFGTTFPSDLKNDFLNFLYDFPDDYNGNGKKGKYLGYYTPWVKTGLEGEIDAATKIKENFAKSKLYKTETEREYDHLWSLWNFGGGANDNAIPYGTDELRWGQINGDFLTKKITDALEDNIRGNKIDSFATGWEESAQVDNTESEDPSSDEEDDETVGGRSRVWKGETVYLEYIGFVESDKNVTAVKEAAPDNGYYYGMRLPVNEHAGTIDSEPYYERYNPIHGGCFAFTANGSGHLSITARAVGTGASTVVYAQVGKKNKKLKFEFNSDEPKTEEGLIDIPGDSQVIYIFTDSKAASDAIIYKIEYIQDKYLYETDRSGIKPTADYPIQMYGIASYGKLKDLWIEGTSFDLNDYNGTSPDDPDLTKDKKSYFHPVPLLRSVAKVIVRIPKALKAKDVFLRSVNINARWEPADVKSNTLDIWNDHPDPFADFLEKHSKYCEFYNIMAQDPFYNSDANSSTDLQKNSYKEKFRWFYGTWVKQGLIKGVDMRGTKPSGYDKNNKAEFDYPHIMNAMIDRSDFVEFLKAGTEDIYDKYVLYVPEKYVDDPEDFKDSNGIELSAPKVCHIEFRVDGDPDLNLDDNNCYRIYFTENGFNSKMTMPDFRDDDHTWEKMYEQNTENLKEHYPIIRNHCYQFTVQDITKQIVIVSLEVLPWKKVKDIQIEW